MSGSPRLHPVATPDEEGMEVAETLEPLSKIVFQKLSKTFMAPVWSPYRDTLDNTGFTILPHTTKRSTFLYTYQDYRKLEQESDIINHGV